MIDRDKWDQFFEEAEKQTPQDDDGIWTPGDFDDDDDFLESDD